MNTVTISGNLTKDCEERQTQSGGIVASFRVAVNDRRQNQQTGEWEDYPNYIKVVKFYKSQSRVPSMLVKGKKVYVEGKLHQNRWQGNDGQNRQEVEVRASTIEFEWPKENSQPTQDSIYDVDIPF